MIRRRKRQSPERQTKRQTERTPKVRSREIGSIRSRKGTWIRKILTKPQLRTLTEGMKPWRMLTAGKKM